MSCRFLVCVSPLWSWTTICCQTFRSHHSVVSVVCILSAFIIFTTHFFKGRIWHHHHAPPISLHIQSKIQWRRKQDNPRQRAALHVIHHISYHSDRSTKPDILFGWGMDIPGCDLLIFPFIQNYAGKTDSPTDFSVVAMLTGLYLHNLS